MKGNSDHKAGTVTGGKAILPLNNFFIALKQNGFLVTPKQVADSNVIILHYSGTVKNEYELCYYLSPIFANNQEEQIQFREIFQQHFNAQPIGEKEIIKKNWLQKIITHLKKHWWKYILAAAICFSVINYFLRHPLLKQRPTISISAIIADSNFAKQNNTHNNRFVKTTLHINDVLPDAVPDIKLKTKYNWGDSSAPDTLSYHAYSVAGNFLITAYTEVWYKKYLQYTDTVTTAIPICFENNKILIRPLVEGDSITAGKEVTLNAIVTGNAPRITWTDFKGDSTVKFRYQNTTAWYTFEKEGQQIIYCTAVSDSVTDPCAVKDSISFFVYDPRPKPKIIMSVPPGANLVQQMYKVKRAWFYGCGLLTLLSLFLTVFFALRWSKSKKNVIEENEEIKQEYQNLIQSFSGRSGSVQIPFKNKNYLPLPEEQISEVARQMRKRISDDTTYLHLQKTIAKAINNAGFFEPVMASRTQQSEYLVLIDDIQKNSQQVKLFDYLLELFAKQNVFVKKFYYRHDPQKCYSASQAGSISLEKLSEKYPKHILLIFGDAYQLIYKLYTVIDASYLQILNHWQYKAILTPVTFLDWGNNEKKVLLEEIPVLPIDIAGQILLMQKLFGEEINILADLEQYRGTFYETGLVNFEDIDDLYAYCKKASWANIAAGDKYNNILFQWIAALAVYPKIQWELLLAIGKAIMDKYGKGNELNFTTLLRIARIKWMAEGSFPDETRLSLLKNLSKENEIIARETVLAVLKEIPEAELSREHFAYEEKETQRLINEFNLYAHDPVKYAMYKKARDLMGELWRKKQMTDAPAQIYIENKNLQWDTLINKPLQPGEQTVNAATISASDYFGIASTGWLSKLYLLAVKIFGTLFSLSLVALVLLAIINFSGHKKIAPFTFKQSLNTAVKIAYRDSTGVHKSDSLILRIDTSTVILHNDKPAIMSLPVDDSIKNLEVQLDNSIILDTAMPVQHDAYTLTMVKNAVPEKPAAAIVVRLLLTTSCLNSLNSYKSIIGNTDSSFSVVNEVIAETNRPVIGPCLSMISFGKNVTIQKVNGLIKAFDKAGVNLKIGNQREYTAGENEIIIYNVNSTTTLKSEVHIQISDNSLIESANAFRKELAGKGFTVKPVNIQNYNYNSEISYYDSSTAAVANSITKYYNKYYPQMNVQARLRRSPNLQQYKNIIAVWIKKMDTAEFIISNAAFATEINLNQSLNVTFDIINKNNGKIVTGLLTGKICLYSQRSNCTNFDFNSKNITIIQQLNTSGLAVGKHEIRVTIAGVNINTSLGFFTITDRRKNPCDSFHLYVNRDGKNSSGIVNYRGKPYLNRALSKEGITVSLIERNSGYAIVELAKDKCPLQKTMLYPGKAKTINFCDGTKMNLTLLDWENKAASYIIQEALFDVIICARQANNVNQSAY